MKSNNNFRYKDSSRDSRSCSPCNFLTIPLIHRKHYDLDKQRETADSKFSLNLENNITETPHYSLKNADVDLDTILARRVSAREVVFEGQNLSNWSKAARESTSSNNREELMPLEPATTNDVNKGAEKEEEEQGDKEIEKADSPILQVPVVKVTPC